MSEHSNHFARLSAINVSDNIERKGGFSYLSWPFAVAQLRLAEPTASWEVRRFDGLPYLATEAGVFVEVAVTVQGVTLSQIHPVLDTRNRPIPQPTAFDINTSIQRCLVKAIALHGLGLYIYAGEDLPQIGTDPAANDAAPPPPPAPAPSAPSAPAVTRGHAPQPTRPSPVRPAPVAGNHSITLVQQRTIARVAEEVGIEMTQLLEYFGVNALGEIAAGDFQRVMRALAKRRAA